VAGDEALQTFGPESIRIDPEDPSRVVVRMSSARALSVHVVAPSGEAIDGARVTLLDRVPGAADLRRFEGAVPRGPASMGLGSARFFSAAVTDERGIASLTVPSSEARVLFVSRPGFASAFLDVPDEPPDPVEVVLRPVPTASLTIAPSPRDALRVTDRILLENTEGVVWPESRDRLRLAREGTTRIEDVPHGVWRIHTFGAFADLLQSPWFEVVKDEAAVDLDLGSLLPASVDIALREGESGVRFRLLSPVGVQDAERKGQNGSVSFSALAPGRWRFDSLSGRGEVVRTFEVEIRAGEHLDL
jgi:hypothetical protein